MSVIKELYIENFKKIKLISISAGSMGNVVTLQGRNGQGKSSIIDSLLAALGGPKFTTLPIRQGQKDSLIEATLDDGTKITRQFLPEGKHRLTVVRGDGQAQKSPQAWLSQLMSSIAFEPHGFLQATPLERVRLLYKLLGLEASGVLDERKTLLETRKLLKRNKKELASQCVVKEGLPVLKTTVNLEIVKHAIVQVKPGLASLIKSEGDTLDQWESINQALNQYERIREQREHDIVATEQHIARLSKELTEAQKKLDGLVQQRQKSPAIPEALVNDVHIGREEAKVQLKQSAENAERVFAEKQFAKVEFELGETQQKLEAVEKTIANTVESILGSKDYSLGDNDVLVKGIPFNQLSQSEQLLQAVQIAFVQNPELRVVRLTEGSLLDNETQTKLEALAVKYNFQVWLEKVSDSTEMKADTLIIEDGEIRSV